MKRKIKEEEERERVLHLYDPEGQYYRQGLYHVAGIDEAGRGPAAGPVMVAAVILPPYWDCPGSMTAKKYSPPNETSCTIKSWPKRGRVVHRKIGKGHRPPRHLPCDDAGHV